ncbi:MAG: hypothetical protein JXQ66_04575, partial [Campylobacterales bacterium]|nr:hypothetical protein [Campylobacterales bacterium]
MSSDLEKLREIGAQKIFEQTHITKEHVQAILHKSFEGLNKVQFNGFISILEREYQVDLKDVKEAASSFYNQQNGLFDTNKEQNGVFVTPEKEKKSSAIYIIFSVLIISLAILYFNFENSLVDESKVDNSLIESVKK